MRRGDVLRSRCALEGGEVSRYDDSIGGLRSIKFALRYTFGLSVRYGMVD